MSFLNFSSLLFFFLQLCRALESDLFEAQCKIEELKDLLHSKGLVSISRYVKFWSLLQQKFVSFKWSSSHHCLLHGS